MSAPMQTATVSAIDGESIRYLIAKHLAPVCPPASEISVINRP